MHSLYSVRDENHERMLPSTTPPPPFNRTMVGKKNKEIIIILSLACVAGVESGRGFFSLPLPLPLPFLRLPRRLPKFKSFVYNLLIDN